MHQGIRVAVTRGGISGKSFLNALKFLRRELDFKRGYILFQIFAAFGARNCYDVLSLPLHPGQSQLGWSADFFFGNLLDARDQVQISMKIFSLKTWEAATLIISIQVFKLLKLAS